MVDLAREPGCGQVMVDMTRIQQGDEDIDIEQGAPQIPSRSRSSSMSALVTGVSRGGKGRTHPARPLANRVRPAARRARPVHHAAVRK